MSNDSVVGQIGDTIGLGIPGASANQRIFGGGDNSFMNNPSANIDGLFGGDNSFIHNPNQIFGGENSFFHKPLGVHGGPADPTIPDAGPSEANIRQDQLQSQLKDEQKQRASSTLFTGGSGLLDQPTTASHVLLGS